MIGFLRMFFFVSLGFHVCHGRASDSVKHEKSHSIAWGYVFQRPQLCLLKKVYPCFVDTRSGSEYLPLQKMDVFLAAKTRVEFISATQLRLLQGKVLLQKKEKNDEDIRLDSSSGSWTFQGAAMFLKAEDVKTRSLSLQGDIAFQAKANPKKFFLSQGFENWYQGTSADGQPWMGVMQPLNISKLFPLLPKSLFQHPQKTQWLSEWKKNVLDAQTEASDFYKEQVERKIASMEEEQLQQERQHQRRLQEKNRILRIYRTKQDPDFSADLKSLSAE